MAIKNQQLKLLIVQLENITSQMEVPVYRRRNVAWLNKNLAVKNKTHPEYETAMKLITELLSCGVSHG